MFSFKKSTFLQVKNILSEQTIVDGDICLCGNTKIDGTVNGNISCEGDVIIGQSSKVTGNITAENVIISGTVKGNVTSSNLFSLTCTGSVTGDVTASSMMIDEGAVFSGVSNSVRKGPCSEENEQSD